MMKLEGFMKVISWLKNLGLRQILTVFLVGLTVLAMQAFGYGNTLQAQADEKVESPLGIYYKTEPGEPNNINNDNKLVENARRNLKETADNARGKANKTADNIREKANKAVSGNSSSESVESPLGIYYKGEPDGTGNINNGNNLLEKARKNVKETADDVRQKLNEGVFRSSADTVITPEGAYYKAVPDNTVNTSNKNMFEKAAESLKETAETVKEKLNLDEPVPESTKEFLRSTEEKVEDTVKPITGTKEGYYQTP